MGKISVEQQLLAKKWKLLVAGFIAQLLVPLLSAYRYEGEKVNMTLAKSEAKILHKMIADKVYNHEEIIRILTTRSKAQLITTFNHYNNEFGHPINKETQIERYCKQLTVGMQIDAR